MQQENTYQGMPHPNDNSAQNWPISFVAREANPEQVHRWRGVVQIKNGFASITDLFGKFFSHKNIIKCGGVFLQISCEFKLLLIGRFQGSPMPMESRIYLSDFSTIPPSGNYKVHHIPTADPIQYRRINIFIRNHRGVAGVSLCGHPQQPIEGQESRKRDIWI